MSTAFWLAGGVTVLALIYTGIIYGANKWALPIDRYIVEMWLLAAAAWAYALLR